MNSVCFQITFQGIISNFLCSQNYLVFLYVTQCLRLSSLCMYAPVIIKHTDTQTRETETDIMRDRDERDRDIREVIHITGGCQL